MEKNTSNDPITVLEPLGLVVRADELSSIGAVGIVGVSDDDLGCHDVLDVLRAATIANRPAVLDWEDGKDATV